MAIRLVSVRRSNGYTFSILRLNKGQTFRVPSGNTTRIVTTDTKNGSVVSLQVVACDAVDVLGRSRGVAWGEGKRL